eukprot:9172760-Pyramimonas_sp.AAC.1
MGRRGFRWLLEVGIGYSGGVRRRRSKGVEAMDPAAWGSSSEFGSECQLTRRDLFVGICTAATDGMRI